MNMARQFGLRRRGRCGWGAVILGLSLFCFAGWAQPPEEKKAPTVQPTTKSEAAAKTPEKVEVKPMARDDEIADRLTRILLATGWFRNVELMVREGVVFIKGRTTGEEFKKWASDLARSTRDVVAVVNDLQLDNPPFFDFSVLVKQLAELGRASISGLPTLLFAAIVLPFAWLCARMTARISARLLKKSMKSELLRWVVAKSIGLMLFLIAVYLVLRVSGLTQLALTLAGGTGLLGLALGIAFKEITENFLASIYLSIQKPFEVGDLVEVDGLQGFVQSVTARTTILMTTEGNHVQIPNAIVFKNTIRNYTSSSNRRVDFVIGISYQDSLQEAQETVLGVLNEHPAVLKDPEPWVLVDGFGQSTMSMRIYFWLNSKEHSLLKVRSAIIRLTKSALQHAGISLTDSTRAMVFPEGVPVQVVHVPQEKMVSPVAPPPEPDLDGELDSSAAEGGLRSEAKTIQKIAKHSRMPEEGENLLKNNGNNNSSKE